MKIGNLHCSNFPHLTALIPCPLGRDHSIVGYPATTPTVGYYYVAGLNSYKHPTPETGCSHAASVDKFWDNGYTGAGSGTGAFACTVTKTSAGTSTKTSISFASGTCPTDYTLISGVCTLSGSGVPVPATETDWSTAEGKLNDPRFIDELVSGSESLSNFVYLTGELTF